MKKFLTICVVLLLAANAFAASTLVYDGGGGQATIQAAMTELGIAFDLRDFGNPVTAGDLTSHDLLVVGWNAGGNMTGLPAAVLAGGITGNILLTGHDADVHVVHGYDMGTGGGPVDDAATAFLSQSISFAMAKGGTGLVALGDYSTAFSYLPGAWGISATGGLLGESISSFTAEGLASGVYAGLTPADMSNWGQSYHAEFDVYHGFSAFELGNNDSDVVTVGRVIPAPSALISVLTGLVCLSGYGFRRWRA